MNATLSPGTTYYYRVVATNAGGDSAPSNIASAITEAPVPIIEGTAPPADTPPAGGLQAEGDPPAPGGLLAADAPATDGALAAPDPAVTDVIDVAAAPVP